MIPTKTAITNTVFLMQINWEECVYQFSAFSYHFNEFNRCFRNWQFWMTREDVHKFKYHSWSYHNRTLGRYSPFWTTVNQGAFDMFAEYYDLT